MAASVKYFSGSQEVRDPHAMKNEEFTVRFPGIKGRRYDSFGKYVGHPLVGSDCVLPITRIIFYKTRPSLHKCDSRCRCAKGGNCECSCGGQFHGIEAA